VRNIFFSVLVVVICLASWGCSRPRQNLMPGMVMTEKIAAEWPKFRESWQKYRAERYQIFMEFSRQKALPRKIERRINESGERWQKVNDVLKEEVKESVQAVAREKGLHLVIVNSGVEYGGLDITEDVLKSLKSQGQGQ
jgi:outer membrane protein